MKATAMRRVCLPAALAALLTAQSCIPSRDNDRPAIRKYGPGGLSTIVGFEKSPQEKDVAELRRAMLPMLIVFGFFLSEPIGDGPAASGKSTAAKGIVADFPKVRYPVNPGSVTATVAVTSGDAEDDIPGAHSLTYLLDSAQNDVIRFLDDRAGGLVYSMELGAASFHDMVLSPDQRTLLLVGPGANGQQQALLVDARERAVLASIPFPANVNPHRAAFSPDGKRAYIAVWDGPANGQFDATETRIMTLDMATRQLSPDSVTLPENNGVDAMAMHPSGDLLFVTTNQFELYFVDTRTMTVTQRLLGSGALAVHPTGERIYAGSGVKRIWVFDVATAKQTDVLSFDADGIGDKVFLKLDATGTNLLAGTNDSSELVLLNADTGEEEQRLPIPDGQHLVALF